MSSDGGVENKEEKQEVGNMSDIRIRVTYKLACLYVDVDVDHRLPCSIGCRPRAEFDPAGV